jgi:hypothetical protein
MRTAVALVMFVGIAGAACGHKTPHGTTTETGSGTGTGTGSATGTGVSADAALTKDECVTMLGHIFDLGIAEKKKTWKPEETPTDDKLADFKAKMIEANVQECLQLPRDQYACAIKAQTAAELEACPH